MSRRWPKRKTARGVEQMSHAQGRCPRRSSHPRPLPQALHQDEGWREALPLRRKGEQDRWQVPGDGTAVKAEAQQKPRGVSVALEQRHGRTKLASHSWSPQVCILCSHGPVSPPVLCQYIPVLYQYCSSTIPVHIVPYQYVPVPNQYRTSTIPVYTPIVSVPCRYHASTYSTVPLPYQYVQYHTSTYQYRTTTIPVHISTYHYHTST